MELAEYRVMYDIETTYWWFVARRDLVREWLATDARERGEKPGDWTVFDIGCGTGANGLMLEEFGRVYGTDMSQEALALSRERGHSRLARCRIENLCFPENAFDAITALDMLEHVDDDLAGMKELFRVCKPGGTLLITVPAYGFLWSEHDEALHHRRRYTASELRNKLTVSGFEVERISYFISLLFFPVFAMRFWQNFFKRSVRPKTDLVILPPLVNQMLVWLLAFERWMTRFINFPVGVSIICTARKPL
jgi:ubiquinone/menaquinone biosynthesis C-methylase UbiE